MARKHNGSEVTEDQADVLELKDNDLDEAKYSESDDEAGDALSKDDEESEINTLKSKITELETRVAENWDKAVRAVSELENFRRRSERDLVKARKFGIEGFVKYLIPVMDSLEQAASVDLGDSEHLKEGLELTLKLFKDTFSKNNIELLNPVGDTFDPELHEAMSTQVDPDVEPGTILTVFQKGYQLAGRVIRPARVVVAAQPKS